MIASLREEEVTCKSANFTNTNSGEKTLILILCNEEALQMSRRDVKAINNPLCVCVCVCVGGVRMRHRKLRFHK